MSTIEGLSFLSGSEATAKEIKVDTVGDTFLWANATRTTRSSQVPLLVRMLLAGSVFAAGAIVPSIYDFRQPGAVSHIWVDRRRKRISLAEARVLALRSMTEKDKRLHEERAVEEALLAHMFGDEGVSP